MSADTFTFGADVTGEAGTAAADEDGADAVTVAAKLDSGSNTLNINMTGGVDITGGAAIDGSSDDGETGGDAIDAAAFETVNISSTGTTANSLVGGTGAGGTDGVGLRVNTNGIINVTGTKDINLGVVAGTNLSVDATNFSGKLTVTGEAGNNVIIGGSAVDTLNGGAGQDTLTGGAGADKFVFVDNESTTAASDSISDYAGDVIRLVSTDNVAGASGTAGTTATSNVEVSAGGKVTFAAADDTLAKMLVAIAADTTDVGTNEVAFFEFSGSTYIFNNVGGTDDLITLTGVTNMTTLLESTTTAGDFTLS
jgi:Ca2+-binding RTX toxin-like protein